MNSEQCSEHLPIHSECARTSFFTQPNLFLGQIVAHFADGDVEELFYSEENQSLEHVVAMILCTLLLPTTCCQVNTNTDQTLCLLCV